MGLPPLGPNTALRWDVVRRQVARLEPMTILEVGCGKGALGARLARQAEYLGVEPDPGSFRIAEQRLRELGRGQVRNVTVDALDPSAQFDLVCAFEVLEHMEDDRTALKEWASRARPGGTVLISVPAFGKRYSAYDQLVGHYRRYEPAALRELLHEVGLTDVDVVVYGAPLGYAVEVPLRLLARRRLARQPGQSMQDRTAVSGRWLTIAGPVLTAATALSWPFRVLQRAFPRHGTMLVGWGRVPA